MNSTTILYKRIEPIQIAYIKTVIYQHDEILTLINHLHEVCSNTLCGKPMTIFHGGAVKDGILVEVAFPVSQKVETENIHTRTLKTVTVFSMIHKGIHQTIRDTTMQIYDFLDTHAWTTSLIKREIYMHLDPENPNKNITEVQVVLHEWDKLFAESARNILGDEQSKYLTSGIDSITSETTKEEYTAWIQATMDRFDTLNIDNERKCRIVSQCAHVFPQERIDYLREIYLNNDFDDILRHMYEDNFWYEKPVRHGNMIHIKKNPYNPEGYESALTPAERRKAYCHCSFVHPYLDEVTSKLSPTFCYCGAGWYSRLWEGIIGQPVKFEQVETLLKGNDICTFAITLPIEIEGDFPA